MSTATSTVSSSAADYATQLAQGSAVRRSLSNLGIAIQNGELVPANTILAAFFKANPQYTATTTQDSSAQNPLSQDFQTLATALSNNQTEAAKSAWTQIKNDFSKQGINLNTDSATATTEAVAQSKASMNQQIISDMFGVSSGSSPSVATLIGGSQTSDSQIGVPASLIQNWLTYQQSGTATPATTTPSAGSILNTSV